MTTTDPPTTPKRNRPNVPVFSPCPAMPTSTLFPRNDDPDVLLDISLPPGCDLIVQSVGGPDRKMDPVHVVNAAVQSIIKVSEDLADIPVVVHPFPFEVQAGPLLATFDSTLSSNQNLSLARMPSLDVISFKFGATPLGPLTPNGKSIGLTPFVERINGCGLGSRKFVTTRRT